MWVSMSAACLRVCVVAHVTRDPCDQEGLVRLVGGACMLLCVLRPVG